MLRDPSQYEPVTKVISVTMSTTVSTMGNWKAKTHFICGCSFSIKLFKDKIGYEGTRLHTLAHLWSPSMAAALAMESNSSCPKVPEGTLNCTKRRNKLARAKAS